MMSLNELDAWSQRVVALSPRAAELVPTFLVENVKDGRIGANDLDKLDLGVTRTG
jgi:hypothetical protein